MGRWGDASHRRLWRALSAAPLPILVGLWALWRDLVSLGVSGLSFVGGWRAATEWGLLSLVTGGLVACFWSRERAIRVLGYTFYSLALAVGFAVSLVLGVFHAFGGPRGDLTAPGWALAVLGIAGGLCAAALLAAAALFVDDVRAAGRKDD